jgi:hypothetical protein
MTFAGISAGCFQPPFARKIAIHFSVSESTGINALPALNLATIPASEMPFTGRSFANMFSKCFSTERMFEPKMMVIYSLAFPAGHITILI